MVNNEQKSCLLLSNNQLRKSKEMQVRNSVFIFFLVVAFQLNAQLSLTFQDGKQFHFEGKQVATWTTYNPNKPMQKEYSLQLFVLMKENAMEYCVYKEKWNNKEPNKWEDVWMYSVRKDQPSYEPTVSQFTSDSTGISYYNLAFFTDEETAFEYDIYLSSSSKPLHQKFTAISFQSDTEAPLLEIAAFFKWEETPKE